MGLNFKILHTADWHLGHPRVKTQDTSDNIREFLFPRIPDVKLLVIAGDIFDGRISFNSPDTSVIIDLFVDLLKLCYTNNVVVRIVRGTYSHDILQNNVVTKLYGKLGLQIDFRVINDLSVESIESLGITLLFIPDNLPFKDKRALLRSAADIMTASDITQVDYVVMHGEFDILNYGNLGRNIYTLSDFDKICKYLVLSGHIHKPQRAGKLIYSGSINRLAHNEEEAKGYWIVQETSAEFVENTDSTLFLTFDYTKISTLKEALVKYSEDILQFGSKHGYFRIVIDDIHIRQALLLHHLPLYPNIRLTFKASKRKETSQKYLDDKIKEITEIREVPTSKNISSIVAQYLETEMGVCMDLSDIEMIIN